MSRKQQKADQERSTYEIKPLETEKNKIPLRSCMKKGIIARFPSSTCISGRSGSGKTQLLLNLLTNEKLLGNYFHYIIVFSPTANETDDTYNALWARTVRKINQVKEKFN